MKIGSWDVLKRVLIIAEIGNNHEGNIETAKELVRQAAHAGAGAVKFQTFQAQHFVSPADPKRFERLKSFELSHDQFRELHDLAKSLGLLFLSTPLDRPSAHFLTPLVDGFKIASCDNTFKTLLSDVCQTGKPVIVSGGLADEPTLRSTKAWMESEWRRHSIEPHLAILHCVSAYPVPDEQANLLGMVAIRDRVHPLVGYSDHTLGIDACLASVALGARIIEKHFTLNKQFSDFRDHQLSADPTDLRQLVERVHRIEQMLGCAQKQPQPCEVENESLFRRSIAAVRPLSAGHRIKEEDLMWIRPRQSPCLDESVLVGKTLQRDIRAGEFLKTEDVH